METIDLDKLDPGFKDEIANQPGAEHIRRCFTCGTCTAACPVAEVHTDYDPRRIIRMCLLGMRREVLSSDLLWMCSRCYTCHALCPQGVKFTDIIGVLRDMAKKEGYVTSEREGQARELDCALQKLRTKVIEHKLQPDPDLAENIRHSLEDILQSKW